jgi:transposase
MKQIHLTSKQKSILEERHHLCTNRKEGDRIKAVLLRSEEWTVPMISQALRIHESTVTRHLDDYRQGKLTIASGGSISILNENQTAELMVYLEEHTHQTTQEIISYVQEKYGVSYSIPGMNKWLHRNGFSYKKPKGYPHKASKEEQEKFISSYNDLKKDLGSNEGILFMDSCHPSMATKISHGWIKKGQSKPIETTAGRTRVNLIGAINLSKLTKPIVGTYSTVDGESIVDFLQQVRKSSGISGVIHLILDQAGYHRNAEVIEESEKLNIKLHFLPPYSPNLNPIERLWKIMNEYSRNNRFFKTAEEFRQSISNFFAKTVSKIGSVLCSRINDNFQKLDYAF